MPVEGRGPELGAVRKGGRDLTTDGSLKGSAGSVRKLQTVLHEKAKEEPDRRFHALVDKVWRRDFLLEAWELVRRNGGAAGVDGVTVADVVAYGVERWVGELSRDLRDGAYEPNPVRQVLIPKKQPGKFRPLGIPCLRDRVAQTSATLVLGPIFEADLQPEQYAYRSGRSARDAVKRIHRLLYRGHGEVVDADLSNYFGEYPCQEGTDRSGAGETRRTEGSCERGMRSLRQARARGWSCSTLLAGWVHGVHAWCPGAYAVQMRSCWMSALARTRSFRITAVRATFGGFPLATRAVYVRLRSGLYRIATNAGM